LMGAGNTTSPPNPNQYGPAYLSMLEQYSSAQPGILQSSKLYEPAYTNLGLAQRTSTATSGVNTAGGLANSIYQIMQNYNPQATAALGTAATNLSGAATPLANASTALTAAGAPGGALANSGALTAQLQNTAQQQMATGGALDPGTMTLLTQNLRAAQGSRGMGNGPGDAAVEAQYVTNTEYQRMLQQQQLGAQAAAAGQGQAGAEEAYAGANSALSGAYQNLAGANAGLATTSSNIMGNPFMITLANEQPVANTSSLINPAQSDAMLGTAYNAQAASNIGNANAQNALLSGWNSVL
jgi:hypothetical protein